MKKHILNLQPSPFAKIREGRKTIELRLCDEKRKQISIGDGIQFINAEVPAETLYARVEDIFLFDSFDELYQNLPLAECGYGEDELLTASPCDMEVYYSKEKQAQYGVMGIKISLV